MKLKLVLVKKSSDPNLAMTELQMHVQVFLNFFIESSKPQKCGLKN